MTMSNAAVGTTFVPSVSMQYATTGMSTKSNALGMRPMQERAYEKRGEQYLLIKSPPASGKSRALMFIALDKVHNQGVKQAIVVVPERTIGASFQDTELCRHGFWADWRVDPRWNLCDAPGTDMGKVDSVQAFLCSDDKNLICTHATFRFAVERFGIEAFDGRLITIDEFHHVSANPDNRLGSQLAELIARDKTHIVAMTGSYFRGDSIPVLTPEDEAKFESVTYTYYEQLSGYDHLKQLDIGYYFYAGRYTDDIMKVLKPHEKTIVHIPSVTSRESTKDKIREVEEIINQLGEWQGADPDTGFQLVKTPDGRVLRVADLVDDNPVKRDKVAHALKQPEQNLDKDYVDIIIALGMAKEGFDWIWCEHALTIGYRSSLTEIVQIIGRATRDAPGKTRTRFTNLIAQPDATQGAVSEAVNDTLKAIAASLLMEQVLAPRFDFRPKHPGNEPEPGLDYGPEGYKPGENNVGVDPETGGISIEVKGLVKPKTPEGQRVVQQDLTELVAAFVQKKEIIERGTFDEDLIPAEITQVGFGKIIAEQYPGLEEDHEAIRQHAIAHMNIMQAAKGARPDHVPGVTEQATLGGFEQQEDGEPGLNTALIDGIRRFALDMRELDIDMIDRINPFGEAYAVLSKTMNTETLQQVSAAITGKRTRLSPDEALELAKRAAAFKQDRGRAPDLHSPDAWERHLAEAAAAFMRYRREGAYSSE